MRYISTRGKAPALPFADAMLAGLAQDGGLYVPQQVPRLAHGDIAALAGLSFEEVAFRVMHLFMGGSIPDAAFREILARAYGPFRHPARAPLVQLAPKHFLLELFHGPTLAFKDFAMQIVGQFFQYELAQRGQRATIVGATSGDTGSAAIEAFRGLPNVDVFILYPDGRISDIQRRQMSTATESNVHVLALEGDFDACQARVKDMFNDQEFRHRVGLAAVNSINWARVLAQVVYYFVAAVALGAPHRAVNFTVPTGNFGNVFAGYMARRMGLPIDTLVIATNHNDILHRCLQTGDYHPREVRPSLSPSMDIQVSSNFERILFDAYEQDSAAVRRCAAGAFAISPKALAWLRGQLRSGRVSEAETLATIASVHATCGQLLCPHSAVGVRVAQSFSSQVPMISLATAHAAKFPDALTRAIGCHPALPAHMAPITTQPERITKVANDLGGIMGLIKDRITTP